MIYSVIIIQSSGLDDAVANPMGVQVSEADAHDAQPWRGPDGPLVEDIPEHYSTAKRVTILYPYKFDCVCNIQYYDLSFYCIYLS